MFRPDQVRETLRYVSVGCCEVGMGVVEGESGGVEVGRGLADGVGRVGGACEGVDE